MFLLYVFINIASAEECEVTSLQSPIDIVEPFAYLDPEIEFYLDSQTNAILYHDGYNVRIDGDFGGFLWGTSYFWSTELLFKSPSEHTLEGQRLDMEMQIFFRDQYDNQAVIVAFFVSSTHDSDFLNEIGFGNPNLRSSGEGWLFKVKYPVDVNTFLGYPETYLYYEGSTTLEPCSTNVTWIILTKTYRVSSQQIKNFPSNIVGNYREIQPLNTRDIFSNFDESDITEAIGEISGYISDNLIKTLSSGESYKPVNDDFIVESDNYEDKFPEVDSVYT